MLVAVAVASAHGRSDSPDPPKYATASVRIAVAEKDDILLVPTRAIKRDKDGKYVEVLGDGDFVRVGVEVGLSDDTYTEIVSGLDEGVEVVTRKPRTSPFDVQGG